MGATIVYVLYGVWFSGPLFENITLYFFVASIIGLALALAYKEQVKKIRPPRRPVEVQKKTAAPVAKKSVKKKELIEFYDVKTKKRFKTRNYVFRTIGKRKFAVTKSLNGKHEVFKIIGLSATAKKAAKKKVTKKTARKTPAKKTTKKKTTRKSPAKKKANKKTSKKKAVKKNTKKKPVKKKTAKRKVAKKATKKKTSRKSPAKKKASKKKIARKTPAKKTTAKNKVNKKTTGKKNTKKTTKKAKPKIAKKVTTTYYKN